MNEAGQKPIRLLTTCFTVIFAVRLAFPRLFGLLDNDSIVIFTDAEHWINQGTWTMMSTLHVWLVTVFYRLLGVHLHSARWVSVLAGLGIMLILYYRGLEDGDREAGVFSAWWFAILPIALFYGTSALPYGALAFFGLLGNWLLARALDRGRVFYALCAGLAWGAAFLCKTFAAVFVVPAGILFLQAIVTGKSRRQKAWIYPLLAGAAWGLVIAAVVLWRWPVYGSSVFNDYLVDWRFDMATKVWSAIWVGHVNLHSLFLPLLAPGLFLAWRRGARQSFDRIAFWSILAISGVFFANPVNHFPRVLFPMTPYLAWFAGRELAATWKEDRNSGTLPAWALTCIVFALFTLGYGRWLLLGQPWTMLLSVVIALALFFVFRVFLTTRSRAKRSPFIAAMLLSITAFGVAEGFHRLDLVERSYGARIEAVRSLDLDSGVLGGSDVLPFVGNGRNNWAELTDLPRERLKKVLSGHLADTLREMQITGVVEDQLDTQGTLAMLAGFGQEFDLDPDRMQDPYRSLDKNRYAARLFDNGPFAAYRLDSVAPLEDQQWPEWSKVTSVWDRGGLMIYHPTEACLRVTSRPLAEGAYLDGMERKVVAELTDRPGNEDFYDVEIALFDEMDNELWTNVLQVGRDEDEGAPGIRLYRFVIDRPQNADADVIIVPAQEQGARAMKIKAVPLGGAKPLWVLVRLPAWW